jgi:hypothetical protein
MPDQVSAENILNLRMEYPLLATAVFSLGNTYWLGYGVFFSLNTLLATVLGALYFGGANQLSSISLKILRIGIPFTGIIISVIAIYAAWLISELTETVVNRGVAIDGVLHTELFKSIEGHSRGFPWATSIGSGLFAVLWLGALISPI